MSEWPLEPLTSQPTPGTFERRLASIADGLDDWHQVIELPDGFCKRWRFAPKEEVGRVAEFVAQELGAPRPARPWATYEDETWIRQTRRLGLGEQSELVELLVSCVPALDVLAGAWESSEADQMAARIVARFDDAAIVRLVHHLHLQSEPFTQQPRSLVEVPQALRAVLARNLTRQLVSAAIGKRRVRGSAGPR